MRHTARGLVAIIGGLPVLVLGGWMFDIGFLKSVMPGYVVMNPVTALMFIVCAVVLVIAGYGKGQWRGIGLGLAGAAAIMGMLIGLWYVGGPDLGLDRWLFTGSLGANRMAPNTALNFVLIGAGLMLLLWERTGRLSWLTRALFCTVAVIAVAAILGYMYGIRPLYGLSRFVPMALHTASLFVLVATAGISLTIDKEKGLLNRRIVLVFGALALAFLPLSMISYRGMQRLVVTNQLVSHTHEVLADINAMRAELVDLETGQRGYIITGRESYLEPYTEAKVAITDTLSKLKRETADNPGQQARIDQVGPLIGQKQQELEHTIELRRTSGIKAATEVVLTDRGKQYLDEARSVLAAMAQTEQDLLSERNKQSQLDVQNAYVWLSLSTAAGMGLAMLLLALVYQAMSRRRVAELALAAERDAVATEKRRAEVLLGSIGDGVVAIDKDWNITLFNRAAEELTGWREGEALGTSFRDKVRLIKEQDRSEYVTFIAEAMLYSKTYHLTEKVALIRKDGSEMPIGDSAAPILDDGKVVGAVIAFRDATQERENQRLKSDFAYASHQLRTPVSQLMAVFGAAQTEKKMADVRADLELGMVAAESIGRLAGHLAAVAELDQGLVTPTLVPVPLHSVLQEVERGLNTVAAQERVQLEITVGDELVLANERLLSVALTELLHNALLYSDAGQKAVVRVRHEAEQTIVEVESHGPVVSEEELPLIFTKFFRGSNKPADAAGSGLGLYLVRGYATLMNGKIWFSSRDGATTFSLSLRRPGQEG